MDDAFESAWLKFGWAVVRAQELAGEINAFAQEPNLKMPIRIGQEYDAKCHCIVLWVDQVDNLFPLHWGLRLGDVVHNFRSSLDHVAWALYKRGHTPNLREHREALVSFPIYATRRKFRDSLPRKLPGVRRADLTKVRSPQPYDYAESSLNRHPLWVVNELARVDKHRTFQPVVPVPEKAGYDIQAQVDCIFRRTALRNPRGILQPGAPLARIYVKKTGPDPYLDMQPYLTIDPAINDRLGVQEFLGKTILFFNRVLRQFSEPPPSALAIIDGQPWPAPKGDDWWATIAPGQRPASA